MEDKKYPIGGYAPGNYHCRCGTCERSFFGDKRAYQCEPCAIAAKEKFDALSPEEQKELMERNAEAIREVFKNFGKPNKASGAVENKYTRDQIKDAIWNELKESDYTGENNERAYEVIGIVMAGIDKIGGEARAGAVWVKATARLPGWDKLVEWRFAGKEPTAKETVRFLSSAANIHQWEWLDESAPSGERESDAVAFAEWLRDNTVPDGAPKLFYKHDISRYTTAQLYDIFKQNRNNVNS